MSWGGFQSPKQGRENEGKKRPQTVVLRKNVERFAVASKHGEKRIGGKTSAWVVEGVQERKKSTQPLKTHDGEVGSSSFGGTKGQTGGVHKCSPGSEKKQKNRVGGKLTIGKLRAETIKGFILKKQNRQGGGGEGIDRREKKKTESKKRGGKVNYQGR